MKISTAASDGKVFYGDTNNLKAFEEEVNAHETNLKLKKKQELERQKKLEEERKRTEEADSKLLDKINDTYNTFYTLVKEYEEKNNKRLILSYDYVKKEYKIIPTKYNLDFEFDQHPLSSILKKLFTEND